jgi:hypothetical protein
MSRPLVHIRRLPMRIDPTEWIALYWWQDVIASYAVDTYRGYAEGLHGIIHQRPKQSHASIAAALVTWFGTNCGRPFFQRLTRCKTETEACEHFARESARFFGINHGVRLIEHLCAKEYPSKSSVDWHNYGPIYGRPTFEDFETLEWICRWLVAEPGKLYAQSLQRAFDRFFDVEARYWNQLYKAGTLEISQSIARRCVDFANLHIKEEEAKNEHA